MDDGQQRCPVQISTEIGVIVHKMLPESATQWPSLGLHLNPRGIIVTQAAMTARSPLRVRACTTATAATMTSQPESASPVWYICPKDMSDGTRALRRNGPGELEATVTVTRTTVA